MSPNIKAAQALNDTSREALICSNPRFGVWGCRGCSRRFPRAVTPATRASIGGVPQIDHTDQSGNPNNPGHPGDCSGTAARQETEEARAGMALRGGPRVRVSLSPAASQGEPWAALKRTTGRQRPAGFAYWVNGGYVGCKAPVRRAARQDRASGSF